MLGITRSDVHLGAQAFLALADQRGDVCSERLGLERLVQDHVFDRLVDGLLEARHVRALLKRVQVDEALDLRVEELRVVTVRLDPDNFLNAGYAYTGEADMRRRATCLYVL